MALGCVIGFGCFILAGDFLETAGPLGAAVGIVLGGLAMIVIARSYGLMVRTFPVAGAEFAYAYRAAGRHHAVICGWFLTLGYLSIVPLNATALAILGKFLAPELFARGTSTRSPDSRCSPGRSASRRSRWFSSGFFTPGACKASGGRRWS